MSPRRLPLCLLALLLVAAPALPEMGTSAHGEARVASPKAKHNRANKARTKQPSNHRTRPQLLGPDGRPIRGQRGGDRPQILGPDGRPIQRAENPLRRTSKTGLIASRAGDGTVNKVSTVSTVSATSNLITRAIQAAGRNVRAGLESAQNAARLHLGKRAPIWRNTHQARKQVERGALGDAARTVTKAQLRNPDGTFIKADRGRGSNQRLGLRERFAVWRAQRVVKNESRTALRISSQHGDAAALADALRALDTLDAAGHLGAFARWRIGNKEREALRKTALNLAKQGDFENAKSLLAEAYARSGQRGFLGRLAESFRNKKTARKIHDEALKVARRYADHGRPDMVADVVQYAGEVAVATGLGIRARRLDGRATRLMNRANRTALGLYLKEAEALRRGGQNAEAAYFLLAAREVQVDRTFRQRRAESRLERELERHLDGKSLAEVAQAPDGATSPLDAVAPGPGEQHSPLQQLIAPMAASGGPMAPR